MFRRCLKSLTYLGLLLLLDFANMKHSETWSDVTLQNSHWNDVTFVTLASRNLVMVTWCTVRLYVLWRHTTRTPAVTFMDSVSMKLTSQSARLERRSVRLFRLAPWNKVIFENLTVAELFKKFPTFCGSWIFMAVFALACQWTLTWARSILSKTCISSRGISTLSSHLRLGLLSGLSFRIL